MQRSDTAVPRSEHGWQWAESAWQRMSVKNRICIMFGVIFGLLGLVDLVMMFLYRGDDVFASSDHWSAALGLAVAVNALGWSFARRPPFRSRLLTELGVAVLLATSFLVLYAGLGMIRG